MTVKRDAAPPLRTSHLFTLRLWPEDLDSGQIDWRGKVQHVNSGEVRYFRDWPTLEVFVEGLLRRTGAEGAHDEEVKKTGREPRAEGSAS
jgi:hypothetical protein